MSAPLVMVAAGAGIVLALVIFWLLRGGFAPISDSYASDASLALSFKEHARTLKRGDRKTVIVTVKRTRFQGPVEVSLAKLPDGIAALPGQITIAANKEEGEIALVVYQFAAGGTARIRVRAVAKNLQAEDWLEITVAGGK